MKWLHAVVSLHASYKQLSLSNIKLTRVLSEGLMFHPPRFQEQIWNRLLLGSFL